MVGPFYVINGKVEGACMDMETAEKYGEFKTSPYSHLEFWDNELAAFNNNFDFDYFPRGRVVFNTLRNFYIIFVDKDIKNPEIEFVKGLFNISVCKCLIRLDEHYQCHLCNENYVL